MPVVSALTQCPYLDHHLLIIQYKVIKPYLNSTVSHLHFLISIYFKYHYFEKSTTDKLALSLKSKMYSQKNILPTIMNLLKIKKDLGDFLAPKNPTTKKNYFEHCFQLLEKIESGQIEKYQQICLGEQEGEKISAITCI